MSGLRLTERVSQGVVDTSYKTATITLSILLFIVLVALAAVVVALCCKK